MYKGLEFIFLSYSWWREKKRWRPTATNNRTGLISETQRSAGSAFPAASVPNTLSTAHQQTPKLHPSRITLQRGDTHPPSPRPGWWWAAWKWGQRVPSSAGVCGSWRVKSIKHFNTGLTLAGCFLSFLIWSLTLWILCESVTRILGYFFQAI